MQYAVASPPEERTTAVRFRRPFLPGALVLGFVWFLVVIAPLAGLVLACLQGDFSFVRFKEVLAGDRVLQLFGKTLLIAFTVAAIAAILGWFVDLLLRRAGEPAAQIWVTVFMTGFLLSPYVYVQGWIGWVGNNGLLWKWLKISPASISIYSTAGVVAMLVLSQLPLTVVFIYLSRRFFPAKVVEAADLFGWSRWRRFRLVELPAVRQGVIAGFLWTFIFSFWAYDVPSMLRQNMFSLEILTAFGSFYDYGRGLLLALPPVAAIVLLGCASVVGQRTPAIGANRFVGNGRRAWWPIFALALLPVLVWGAPLAGLLFQVPGWRAFYETVAAAKTEVLNSARNGIIAAALAAGLCFTAAFFLRAASSLSTFRRFLVLPLPWMALPAIVVGMGYVYLFNLPAAAPLVHSNLQLVLIELTILAPLIGMLALVQLSAWPDRWTAVGGLFGLGRTEQFFKIAMPLFARGIAAMFVIGFALAIREVPASLLNYPPGGGTVAISIETMLHFDQPDKVAALCIVQILLLLLCCSLLLAGTSLIQYVRYKLSRRG